MGFVDHAVPDAVPQGAHQRLSGRAVGVRGERHA
jgi:hypothetical protein